MSVRRKPRNPQCSPIMDPVKYWCILRIHSCPHWTKRWWINSSTFISHLGPKLVWKETLLEVSLWHSRLRCCYWSSSGHCWGPGSIPSPGISACLWHGLGGDLPHQPPLLQLQSHLTADKAETTQPGTFPILVPQSPWA